MLATKTQAEYNAKLKLVDAEVQEITKVSEMHYCRYICYGTVDMRSMPCDGRAQMPSTQPSDTHLTPY